MGVSHVTSGKMVLGSSEYARGRGFESRWCVTPKPRRPTCPRRRPLVELWARISSMDRKQRTLDAVGWAGVALPTR